MMETCNIYNFGCKSLCFDKEMEELPISYDGIYTIIFMANGSKHSYQIEAGEDDHYFTLDANNFPAYTEIIFSIYNDDDEIIEFIINEKCYTQFKILFNIAAHA